MANLCFGQGRGLDSVLSKVQPSNSAILQVLPFGRSQFQTTTKILEELGNI